MTSARATARATLVLALGLAGCTPGEGTSERELHASLPNREGTCCAPEEAGEVRPLVDTALVAWLSKARAQHRMADLSDDENSPERAIAALEQLVAGPRPRGAAPEVDEVLADTRARLAELRARQGDFDGAAADVDDGLARVPEPSYFRGHLFEVRGLVEQARVRALVQAGRAAEAGVARERARRASMEAIAIQDEVIRRALGTKRGAE